MVRVRIVLPLIVFLAVVCALQGASYYLAEYSTWLPVPRTIAAATTDSTPADASGKELRVMTYNIRHGEGMDGKVDIGRVAAEIRSAAPDVVALQEVDRYRWRSGMKDQAQWIAKATGMHVYFAASLTSGISQYGNALLSRHPIEDARTVALPGRKEARSIIVARVSAYGQSVTVFATHLGAMRAERLEQLPLITELVQRQDGPKVLLGDFNMEAGDPQLAPLFELVPKIAQRATAPTIRTGQEIDHIGTNLQVEAASRTGSISASDHAPVVAAIKL
jgi:endonuclease/exonuclease/phosphatase family metal-dependent hydrolase